MIEVSKLDPEFKYQIVNQPQGKGLLRCFACGTCSASCPIREIEERYNPRKLIRMAILGMREEVLQNEFIWICANCHTCYERCPQDVKFTEIIHAIRNIALKEAREGKFKIKAKGYLFAKIFTESIKNFGKVWEPWVIIRFFLATKDFKGMLSYLPLGIKFFKEGKISLIPLINFSMLRKIRQIFKKIK
jgi:heterodisulfide reductase subunit C